jgi:hypothetical protein
VARSGPRDLRGHSGGDVVRQASDDDRDGGTILGRLARHGQPALFWLRTAGRYARGASGLSCPARLEAATVSAVAPGPGSPGHAGHDPR